MPDMRSDEIQYYLEEDKEKVELGSGDEEECDGYYSKFEVEVEAPSGGDLEPTNETPNSESIEEKQQFAFDFEAVCFYGGEKDWTLLRVYHFLRENKEVRGDTLSDFFDELERWTGLKIDQMLDQRELGKLITPTPILYPKVS